MNIHCILKFLHAIDCSINGIPACANKVLLTDILRNEWDFKGKMIPYHVYVQLLSQFLVEQIIGEFYGWD